MTRSPVKPPSSPRREALTPPPSTRCRSCGELAEINRAGYCDACDDAGTEATIKGQNGRAGLGYRVY